ncbi:MPT-synthase sulfurylase [Cyanobium sp. CH-040]|nr:MPT-synthase sulfurylase [Cyanobium sp. CH-040]
MAGGERRLLPAAKALLRSAAIALALVAVVGCGPRLPRQASDQQLAAEVERRYAAFRRRLFPAVPDISVADWLSAGRPAGSGRQRLLVDVRDAHEQAVSMLPGAISRQAFERDRERYRDHLIVPYCTIGLRSGLYAQELIDQGFAARNLAGSVLAWAHAGQPFEAGGRSTRRVHVYGADWNLLPRGYEPVLER